jgi:hypothetical protein
LPALNSSPDAKQGQKALIVVKKKNGKNGLSKGILSKLKKKETMNQKA